MKTENVRILVRVQELPDINYKISDINALKLTKKERTNHKLIKFAFPKHYLRDIFLNPVVHGSI